MILSTHGLVGRMIYPKSRAGAGNSEIGVFALTACYSSQGMGVTKLKVNLIKAEGNFIVHLGCEIMAPPPHCNWGTDNPTSTHPSAHSKRGVPEEQFRTKTFGVIDFSCWMASVQFSVIIILEDAVFTHGCLVSSRVA